MYGCVAASTSGLIRNETGADLPSREATSFNFRNSDCDSTLMHLIPASNARCISSGFFPTPENTI